MIACQEGRADYVKKFIDKGDICLDHPPEIITDDPSYVKKPYLMAAVASGNTECVLILIRTG